MPVGCGGCRRLWRRRPRRRQAKQLRPCYNSVLEVQLWLCYLKLKQYRYERMRMGSFVSAIRVSRFPPSCTRLMRVTRLRRSLPTFRCSN
ncbi:protein of unknown function [Candidatus Promineifilum breve]|uniref:Uncharacterized protein n=1 Tax=Candidatus Promineifilum breve TaxID=1806508 RepID=A0A160SZ63_9CHLR|nr:protein of unknown function [Candidatus Promineifilum breve]